MNARIDDIVVDLREQIDFRSELDAISHAIAVHFIRKKKWNDMDEKERTVCVRYCVHQAETEEDLRSRLHAIGLMHVLVTWYTPKACERNTEAARQIMHALGGLVSKSGAFVTVETVDGTIR
jgi:hypothetical protein